MCSHTKTKIENGKLVCASCGHILGDAPGLVTSTDPEHDEMVRDARRYRRLQILGCLVAVNGRCTDLLRFSNLDEEIDKDLSVFPHRGEASPLPPL